MPSRRRSLVLCSLPALATLFAASAAHADEPPKAFGERGMVALDDMFAVGIGGSRIGSTLAPTLVGEFTHAHGGIVGYAYDEWSQFSGPSGEPDTYLDTMWFAPSADAFIARGFSLGGTLAGVYALGRQLVPGGASGTRLHMARGMGFTILPRVGYAIPLGETFALWPRLALGYSIAGWEQVSFWPEKITLGASTCMAVADLGLVARVHRHVYLRVAPQLSIDVQDVTSRCGLPPSDDYVNVEFGATAGVGLLLGT